MLDDKDYIHNLDTDNALAVIAGQPDQLKQQYDFDVSAYKDIKNIVLAGMGGSALAAQFIMAWKEAEFKVPFIITRGYQLPGFVDADTLVIASSYSGNTEETLACLADAKKRGAKIVIMTSGGELARTAVAEKLPLIKVPGGLQPRLAVLFGVKGLAALFENLAMAAGWSDELIKVADWMNARLESWTLGNPSDNNQAKQIAGEIVGNAIVMYGGPTLAMPAQKWKIDFNENSKNVAFYYWLPEFNHNEFQGWLKPDRKQLKVIELQSSLDSDQIAKRFAVSNRLLSGKMPEPIVVNAEGESKLEQMTWALLLGDFVSAYLAFLNGINPTPVDLVEQLKTELVK